MVFWVWDPVLEPCVCDLGRCACLQEPESEGKLRTEKAVSELPRSRGLDAVTPVGLFQVTVTTLRGTDVGPQPQVETARIPVFLGDSGGSPLFSSHRDTSSCLPLLHLLADGSWKH